MCALMFSCTVPLAALSNGGFETPDQGASGFDRFPAGADWAFNGAGVAGPSSPWKCNSTSPDPSGDQFAFLQDSSSISQSLSALTVGGNYSISFVESYRTGTSASNDLALILDEGLFSANTIYYNSAITDNSWQSRQSSEFLAEKESYTLTFRTSNPLGGDRSSIIDGVTVTLISGPAAGAILWSAGGNTAITGSSANVSATLSTNTTGTLLLWDTAEKGKNNTGDWAYSSNLGAQAGGNTTAAISGLSPDTAYAFRFYGENNDTTGWSAAYTFSTNLSGAQTPVFTSANVLASSITLTWTDHASNETGYSLSRSDSGSTGPYNTVASLAADSTSYVDTATARQSYYYRLTAINTSNGSETSAASCQTSATVVTSPVLRLQASNYNASTGDWSDSSGLGNDASQGTASARPALVSVQSPKNISVVRFDGNDFLSLSTGIDSVTDSDGFTAFAVLRPDGSGGTIFGGSSGCFQYRVGGTQDTVRQQQLGLGSGVTSLPIGSSNIFSSINAKVNDSAGTFRLDGSDDGSFTASAFSASISYIGNRNGNAEWFNGDIAEIRIYDMQLSVAEITAVEEELYRLYFAVARGTIIRFY